MRFSRRSFVAACVLLPATLAWTPARAQSPNDARLKARLALTLSRFTQWPASAFASPSEPLAICVLHRSEPLFEAFGELTGQSAGGRVVRVGSNPDKIAGACHVLFIHESADRASHAVLLAAAAQPLLTIGDSEGFAARGGMVELVNVNDTLRLDVNLKALRAAQLGLSSQVLKLARQVRE